MQNRVLGVLAGTDLPSPMLKKWALNCSILIAADSGADNLLSQGLVPHIIVGDMDSLQADPGGLTSEIVKIDDQSSSDCDKLLALVEARGHESITLAGLEGDRLDHLLCSLGSVVKSSLRVRLAIRDGFADVLKAGTHAIPTEPGRRVSFVPASPCEAVTIRGVEWPLQDQRLELGGQVSLSNVATGWELEVSLRSGALLVCHPLSEAEIPCWPGEPFAV